MQLRPLPPRRGFSLSELLISIAIGAIALLGTLATLTYARRSTEHGEKMTQAIAYCRQLCEIVRSEGLAYAYGIPPTAGSVINNDSKVALNSGNGPFAAMPDDPNFMRTIVTEQVANSGYEQNLLRITVTVYWAERGADNGQTNWKDVRMVTLSRVRQS